MAAAYANEPAGLLMLWSKGADLNMRRPDDGFTAAHMAAVRGSKEVLTELKKCMADLQLPASESGMTPSKIARYVGQTATAKLIDDLQPPGPSAALATMAARLDEVLAPVRRVGKSLGLR